MHGIFSSITQPIFIIMTISAIKFRSLYQLLIININKIIIFIGIYFSELCQCFSFESACKPK